jgi:hypothetical protein
MNEVKKTLMVESTLKEYVSPEVKVILLHPEGVLCSSVFNGHDGFTFDEVEDL